MMFKTLSIIGEKLNREKITWAVGASLLLYFYGLVEKANDIDLFVAEKDIVKADEVLKSLGQKNHSVRTSQYSTKYFYEYNINGVEVDVMAGFGVNHCKGTYEFLLDNLSIPEKREIQGTEIPLTAPEDWYVLYWLIPGRDAKALLIEKHLSTRGFKNPLLLQRALGGCLPDNIREKIENLVLFESKMC